MARRTISIPAGFAPDGVGTSLFELRVQLVNATTLRPVIGVDDDLGQLTVCESSARLTGEAIDIELSINDDITPSGTQYRVTMSADGRVYQSYFRELEAGDGSPLALSSFLGWS